MVVVEGEWGGDTKAMVADCSDNRLSSSVGLRSRKGVTSLQGFTSKHLPCDLGECGGGGWGGGTFPPAAYGFRQRAGTERRTIWVSHSRPATEPPSVPALPANLAPGRSLGFGQILPGSEADPGDWVALCYALASLAVSPSLPFFCLPGQVGYLCFCREQSLTPHQNSNLPPGTAQTLPQLQ